MFKRAICAFLLILSTLGVGLVNAQPAFAAVTQTRCDRNVCMSISRSSSTGRTVYWATVQLPGGQEGMVVRIRYVGYSAGGTLKGPQGDVTKRCLPCAYKFTINYTYASRDWIYGTVLINGIGQGTPVFSF
jgi:hypothetical protein